MRQRTRQHAYHCEQNDDTYLVSALLNFYCCLLYNPFLCACPADVPGAWTCTDMKGIKYDLVPVDERGTLAWFSGHQLQAGGDSTKVSCYCTKMC